MGWKCRTAGEGFRIGCGNVKVYLGLQGSELIMKMLNSWRQKVPWRAEWCL